jgi:hypothetical protein
MLVGALGTHPPAFTYPALQEQFTETPDTFACAMVPVPFVTEQVPFDGWAVTETV